MHADEDMDINIKNGKWQPAQMARNASPNKKSLFLLSDLGILICDRLFLSSVWSNTPTNGDLGMTFLSALLGLLSVLELNRVYNPLLKGETNNKKVYKYNLEDLCITSYRE